MAAAYSDTSSKSIYCTPYSRVPSATFWPASCLKLSSVLRPSRWVHAVPNIIQREPVIRMTTRSGARACRPLPLPQAVGI